MKKYSEKTREELLLEKESVLKKYTEKKSLGLKLDISRGKPCPEQLALSLPMLDLVNSKTENIKCENGFDIRNYGVIEGIPECRRLFGEILDAPAENVIVTGNSSLNLFYDLIAHAMCHGLPGGKAPWCECKERKLLCPAPGYDRHFAVGELFGFELITVPMNSDGPDMDTVEELIKDETVKGIICVPKYSNPQGISYSAEVVERFAKLSPAASDFRIFWDNAYVVHHLDFDGETDVAYSFKGMESGFEQDLGGGWWEVGVGTNLNLSEATHLYFDVERTYGGNVATPWKWKAGVRWSF